ncbi:MAG TPA: hypothetical protein PKM25_09980 [Candidatus Ozemobacteraceae bacterium]|nr:hypothetical protein [Candidatus Ozemobacteraceae bacterium]
MNSFPFARQGFAMITLLLFMVVLITFVGLLQFSSRGQKGTHTRLFDQTKALMAARAAIELAVYKYRMLPAEFYKVNRLLHAPMANPVERDFFKAVWMNDFSGGPVAAGAGFIPPAKRIVDAMRRETGDPIDLGVESCELVTRKESGYVKDFLRVKAWGSCNGEKKTLEQLVEVEITHGP